MSSIRKTTRNRQDRRREASSTAGARIGNTRQGAQAQHESAAPSPAAAPLPDTLPAHIPPDHPLDVVIGAQALHSAQTAARSLLARAVYLADAPAVELATPYMVRRAAQGMANDAAELSRALADIERHVYEALDTLAAAAALDAAELDAQRAEIARQGEILDALDAAIAHLAAAAESEGSPHAS